MNQKRETRNLKPVLSIIIVNWNTKQLLQQCLDSVIKHTSCTYEIIVVDNGSTDGSQQLAKKYQQVKLIANQGNTGFTKANNQGIKQATGKYILLLNSDTQLHQDTFTSMSNYLENHPQVGIIGPRLLNRDGSLQPSAGNLPQLWGIFANQGIPLHIIPHSYKLFPILKVKDPGYYANTHTVGWVSGACFMIRQQLADQIGLLDENIFMYVEETEWCKRATDAGYQVIYYPETSIYHLEGASSRTGRTGPILGVYKGLYYYFNKHQPAWQLSILTIILKGGALLRLPMAPATYKQALAIDPHHPMGKSSEHLVS